MSTLFVVATPIGNLQDFTHRAEATLKSVALIVCEDTRVSAPLLTRIGAKARLTASFKGREAERVDEILAELNAGHDVALISDAGTPLISDPGERLVKAASDAGHKVIPVPGVSAPIALLSVSGLPSERFTFIGFLPSHDRRRDEVLAEYSRRPETLVFFESPRRLTETLQSCIKLFGADRRAAVGRELTKLHEETVRGNLGELHSGFAGRSEILGEVAVAIAGSTEPVPKVELESLRSEITEAAAHGEGTRQIAERLATIYGLSRKDVYGFVLKVLGRN